MGTGMVCVRGWFVRGIVNSGREVPEPPRQSVQPAKTPGGSGQPPPPPVSGSLFPCVACCVLPPLPCPLLRPLPSPLPPPLPCSSLPSPSPPPPLPPPLPATHLASSSSSRSSSSLASSRFFRYSWRLTSRSMPTMPPRSSASAAARRRASSALSLKATTFLVRASSLARSLHQQA